jgi:hypothetical protein
MMILEGMYGSCKVQKVSSCDSYNDYSIKNEDRVPEKVLTLKR